MCCTYKSHLMFIVPLADWPFHECNAAKECAALGYFVLHCIKLSSIRQKKGHRKGVSLLFDITVPEANPAKKQIPAAAEETGATGLSLLFLRKNGPTLLRTVPAGYVCAGGFPRRPNKSCLYCSTPGRSKGLTPSV